MNNSNNINVVDTNSFVINKEVLKKYDACEDGLKWFVRNIKELTIDNLINAEGDYKGYIEWLNDHFFDRTFDKNGNVLTSKDSNSNWKEYTYDKNGNLISFKNSNGTWENYTYTYDENGYFIMKENDKQILKIKIGK